MPFFDPIRIGSSGSVDDYTIDRSLRFSGADQTRLNYTPASGGNKKTYTFSWWLKRGTIDRRMLFGSYNSGATVAAIELQDDHKLSYYDYDSGYRIQFQSNKLFRDPSSWYHFVIATDTTQSTESNRVKIYVNGSQITDWATATYPSQNFEGLFNLHTLQHAIGTEGANQRLHFDGYMADVYFLDGYAYDPSYFGETNATTGQWIPKEYTGSFGNNGYYLKFSDNSGTSATTLGKDSSGNGNNVTPVNFSVSAGAGNDSVEDTPTNNFCVMNPLDMHSSMSTKNGNLQVVEGNDWRGIKGTFGVSSGKWYYELKTGQANIFCGWAADDLAGTNNISTNPQDSNSAMSAGVLIFCDNGKYQLDTGGSDTRVNYSSALSAGDVLGCAIDLDNNTAQFYKQGSALGSIDISSSKLATKKVMPYFINHPFSNPDYTFNFGQQAFAYTPPTGYNALSSANLLDPTILLPNKHFDTLIYTGDGGTQTITGLQYRPDWVWIKRRNAATSSRLLDTVRGSDKRLISNLTDSEVTHNYMPSFNSDGFTLTGNHTPYNKNGSTYVAWNWNAGDTDGKTYTVKVVSDSGNKYRFDDFGTSAVTLDLAEGGTYIFDQSDSSNAGHPLRFYTAADKTGGEYTTGVTTAGTPGSSGAYTQIVVAASAPTLFYQCSVHAGMGGQANTNSTLGSSNFDGTIQTTVKANTTAGFSIVTYTGNGTNNATIGHGLGVAPSARIGKARALGTVGSAGAHWSVNHQNLNNGMNGGSSAGTIFLNLTSVQENNNHGSVGAVSSTTMTLSDGSSGSVPRAHVNENNATYIQYVFSEVAGYSKFGSYVGNGSSSDGTFVFLGFRPAWVMWKATGLASNWVILDSTRDTHNVTEKVIQANESAAEVTTMGDTDFLSNGFKIRSTVNNDTNVDAQTYIYFAFAEAPFRNARAR